MSIRATARVDHPWSDNPRKDNAFVLSTWELDHVRANVMGIAAKGHVLNMNAANLTITELFGISSLLEPSCRAV
jgi:hypothetical protein